MIERIISVQYFDDDMKILWFLHSDITINAFHFVYLTAEYMSASGGGYSSYDNEDQGNRGRRTPVTPPKKHSNALPSECHTA